MKIQCTIPRRREVELGGELYVFEKDEKGRFVCEVEDEAHAERLLEIECYRKVTDAAPAVQSGLGINPPIETTSRPGSTTPITKEEPVIEPNGGEGEGEGDEGEESEGDEKPKLTPEQDLAAARAEYEAHFEKKPHHSQKADRLRQLIAEDLEDKE